MPNMVIRMEKARRKPGLVRKQVVVTREGTTFPSTVWIRPDKDNARQLDLFAQSLASDPAVRDKQIAEAINLATPDNRAKVTAFIAGLDSANRPTEEPYEFTPSKRTLGTIGTLKVGVVDDYTSAIPKKIALVPKKKILKVQRPTWIPDIDERFFGIQRGLLPFVKLHTDEYLVQVDGGPKKKHYALMNLDVLAATHDYYRKKISGMPLRTLGDYGASQDQRKLLSATGNVSVASWQNSLKDHNQKLMDMVIQCGELMSVYYKGQETSYGNANTKKDLLDSHGVLVKRQNGEEITKLEIDEIRDALDDIYAVFGDRSSMARKFGLKISHSGKRLMHARKALGIYMPYYHTIGVTAQLGDRHFGFTLSHEWAHFMDNYLGGTKYHYASDEPGSISNEIARRFRRYQQKRQTTLGQIRTCECFARAFEEYFTIKIGGWGDFEEYSRRQGNYVEPKIFENEVMPLINTYFEQNSVLLKAIRDSIYYYR